MKRREFLSGLALAGALAGPARAEGVVDSVVSQLRDQGFTSITEERTLLGRVRIIAQRDDGLREIIINPRTGEILRDLWTPSSGGTAASHIIRESGGRSDNQGSGGSGQGGGGDDDEDGEDGGNGGSGDGGGGDDDGEDDGEDGGSGGGGEGGGDEGDH